MDKNPMPMFKRLSELEKYNYYFQFTLNAYNKDVEPNIPSKNDIIIPAFQRLSREIGKERVVWRYDPIFSMSTIQWNTIVSISTFWHQDWKITLKNVQ